MMKFALTRAFHGIDIIAYADDGGGAAAMSLRDNAYFSYYHH